MERQLREQLKKPLHEDAQPLNGTSEGVCRELYRNTLGTWRRTYGREEGRGEWRRLLALTSM
eukprot:751427-Hanusia_phi.AAC.3